MRIAVDATYSVDPYPSGIAVYSRELISGLARAYSGDELLCCYRPKQFRRSTAVPFANVHRRLLLPPLPTFRADLFHALNQRVDQRKTKKVVSTFHDLFVITGEYSSADFRTRFQEQARRAAAHSDLIIAVSAFTARQVETLLGVNRSRIRVVPHGVHCPSLEGGQQREKTVLCVGALQIRKNIGRLVEAFDSTPPDWKLVLAGATGGYGAKEILEQIERSRSRDRIRVTGYLTPQELHEHYLRASVFAFPSLAEGFGIPVLEAMAYGLPVVTSKGTALEEVAGEAAMLVDPQQAEELASALQKLIEDVGLRAELAQRGRLRARQFPWERAVHSTHAVYEELTK